AIHGDSECIQPQVTSPPVQPRTLSKRGAAAAVLYTAIAVFALVSLFSGAGFGVAAAGVLAAVYAWYLWRGGSVVIVPLPLFIWLPLAALGFLVRRLRRGS
ncbi:MAG: hypothetical protein QOJ50_2219, partial [Cryptosporangiaceae bacterium]|nr:hypothetical protein [Cryptosporangiaceae bacterium]